MLQRIQTLWLIIASALAFLTLRFSFFSGNKLVDNISEFRHLTAASADNLILLILSVAVGLAALIAVFLFKDRKMQLRIVILTIILSVVNIVLFIAEAQKFIAGEGNYDLTAAFAFAVPVLLILAARGIYKDDRLVKSLDRLR
jgi:glucan phosphoethanolaminetransferase (alkaline phosphatase superfamily)